MAKLRKKNIPYTQVANVVLQDKSLSLKAKGLFAYLFSKPEGWHFSSQRIPEENTDERDSVVSGLKELEKSGYLQRKRRGDGKVDYYLEFAEYPQLGNPSLDSPEPEKPPVVKTLSGKIRSISNTENTSNKEDTATPGVAEAIEAFKGVNPAYKKFFPNTTQRAATQRLLDEHGLQKLLKIIQFLVRSNASPYAPTITTPVQLEDKMGALIAFGEKERSKNNKPKSYVL